MCSGVNFAPIMILLEVLTDNLKEYCQNWKVIVKTSRKTRSASGKTQTEAVGREDINNETSCTLTPSTFRRRHSSRPPFSRAHFRKLSRLLLLLFLVQQHTYKLSTTHTHTHTDRHTYKTPKQTTTKHARALKNLESTPCPRVPMTSHSFRNA